MSETASVDRGRTVVITTDEASIAMLMRTMWQASEDDDHSDTLDEFYKQLGAIVDGSFDVSCFNDCGDKFAAVVRIDGDEERLYIEHVCAE
jgi:hypothetical protein